MLLEFPGSSSAPWGEEFSRRGEPPPPVLVDWRRPPANHRPQPPLYYPGALYSPASALPGRFYTAVPTSASPQPPPTHYLSGAMLPQSRVVKFQSPSSSPAWNSLYTMPAPTYRLPVTTTPPSTLSADPGLDARQRAQLARIAEENEPSEGGGRSAGRKEEPKVDKTMEQIWENIATRLPKLAETVAELGGQLATTTLPMQPGLREGREGEDTTMRVPAPAGLKGFVPAGDEKNSKSAAAIDETRGVTSIINSMPDPNSLFTYSRLLKSVSRSHRTNDGVGGVRSNYGGFEPQRMSRELTTFVGAGAAKKSESVSSGGEEMEGEIKGMPILKSGEDEVAATPRSSATSTATFPPSTTAAPGMQSQSLVMNWLQPFLGSMRLPEPSNNHKVVPPTTHPSTPSPRASNANGDNPAENLLSSIMSGRLNQIDWVNSLLGTPVAPPTQGAAEGNALAQLFGGRGGKSSLEGNGFGLGSLLGSGLDDDATTIVERRGGVDGRGRG